MWSLLESFKQRRARRKYMPEPRRRGTGTITKVAIVAIVVILAASAALQLRGGASATTALIEAARNDSTAPIDLIERAAATHRLLFLSDVPSATAPKQLAVQAIERLSEHGGLDVVALEVDAAEQPNIDRYLSTPKEDASILLSRPRLTREEEGVSRAWIDVFRAVRRMNDKLGADRQIRIIALDRSGWPPAASTSPSEAAQIFGERDSVMMSNIASTLDADPRARILFFTNGLHALKDGTGVIQTGGTKTVQATWLATRLVRSYPQDVFTILVDATPSRIPSAMVSAYRGTAAGPVLRDAGIRAGTALMIDDAFDFSRAPISTIEKPGIHFDLTPHDLRLTSLADAYIYLGS